jgi:hypothetical protein
MISFKAYGALQQYQQLKTPPRNTNNGR